MIRSWYINWVYFIIFTSGFMSLTCWMNFTYIRWNYFIVIIFWIIFVVKLIWCWIFNIFVIIIIWLLLKWIIIICSWIFFIIIFIIVCIGSVWIKRFFLIILKRICLRFCGRLLIKIKNLFYFYWWSIIFIIRNIWRIWKRRIIWIIYRRTFIWLHNKNKNFLIII